MFWKDAVGSVEVLFSIRKFLTRVCWDEGETRKREICLTNNQSRYGCFLNNLPRVLILNTFKKKRGVANVSVEYQIVSISNFMAPAQTNCAFVA